jgi:hypothetical protein
MGESSPTRRWVTDRLLSSNRALVLFLVCIQKPQMEVGNLSSSSTEGKDASEEEALEEIEPDFRKKYGSSSTSSRWSHEGRDQVCESWRNL